MLVYALACAIILVALSGYRTHLQMVAQRKDIARIKDAITMMVRKDIFNDSEDSK